MKKDLIKFILFVISLIVFITGIIINNETMVYFGYLLTILTLLSLDEDQIGKAMDAYKSIPFTITWIVLSIGCVLHNHRLVTVASSAFIFLGLRKSKENEDK